MHGGVIYFRRLVLKSGRKIGRQRPPPRTARSREFAFCSMELCGKILYVVTGLGTAECLEKFAASSIVNHRCRSVE